MSEARASRTGSEESTSSDDELESGLSFLRQVAAVSDATPPSAEPNRIGTRLGQFEVRSELGRGGMGVVYEAEDTKLQRLVALKVLPTSFASDPERRARFLREARSASAVVHPNIAAVYDVCEADDAVFIVMERVEGQTLRKLLEAGLPGVSETLRIAREIARGLTKAHAAGIVHRDLKPDNVLVGSDGSVKILDFGLAKPVGSRERAIDGTGGDVDTRDGRILGTPAYMSPEQSKGKPDDGRSDIFSFGAVLYEMLSGRRAFRAESTVELLIALDRDPHPPLDETGKLVPKRVAELVDRCLRKRPEERFADMNELLEALDLADGPRQETRNRRLLAVGFVLVAVGVAVLAFRLGKARHQNATPAHAVASVIAPESRMASSVAPSALAPVPAPAAPQPAPASASASKRRVARPVVHPAPAPTPATSSANYDPFAYQK